MKRLTVKGLFNRKVLMEELLAAFPEWVQDGETSFSMLGTDEEIQLCYPDAADEKAVQAVIDAHDPAVEHPLDVEERERLVQMEAIAAKDLAELTVDDLNYVTVEVARLLVEARNSAALLDASSVILPAANLDRRV